MYDFMQFVHDFFCGRVLWYANGMKVVTNKILPCGRMRGHMEKQKEKKESAKVVFENIKMVLGAMFRRYPHTKWQVPVYVVLKVAGRFWESLLPALTIAAVSTGSVSRFVETILAVILGEKLLSWSYDYINGEISNRRVYTRLGDISYRFTEKNLVTDYANIESQKQQKMIQKGASALSSNWEGAEQLMRNSVEFVVQMTGLISYAATILVLDIRILIVLICMFGMAVLLRNHAINYAHKHREESTEISRKTNYLKRNSLNIQAGKDVRIYGIENWFHSMYEKLLLQAKNFHTKTEIRWYFPVISDQIWVSVRDVLAYFVLIGMVLSGEMDVSTFTLFLGMISGFSYWIWFVADSYTYMKQSSWQVSDLQKVMDMQDTFLHEEGIPVPCGKDGIRIEFRDVSFRYEDAVEDTLSHISFVIEPGEKLALVGNNGAGKTTLVKLLCGLYMPTGGCILVNDRDIASMKVEEYHKLIGVVFQDISLMAFTIEMNVAGCVEEKIDKDKLKCSLQRAGLWEKIEKLEQGTKTYITQTLDDGGILLSGGETQKLLLARAIYKDGPILVLDEPSSALDPIAESKMYEEYSRLTEGKTSLFISHRLASTKFCDRILLLEKGEILEEGSHEELLERNGRYRELFDIQSHYYREEEVAEDEAEE